MSKFFGSVTREIDGKEYRFVLDFNAICHFEEKTGLNFFERAEAWERAGTAPSGRELRAIIHASMMEHHPDATSEDAGRILSQDMGVFSELQNAAVGGMEPVAGKKTKAAAR